jgi:hypothetical protein
MVGKQYDRNRLKGHPYALFPHHSTEEISCPRIVEERLSPSRDNGEEVRAAFDEIASILGHRRRPREPKQSYAKA